jgi:hypothetical protein
LPCKMWGTCKSGARNEYPLTLFLLSFGKPPLTTAPVMATRTAHITKSDHVTTRNSATLAFISSTRPPVRSECHLPGLRSAKLKEVSTSTHATITRRQESKQFCCSRLYYDQAYTQTLSLESSTAHGHIHSHDFSSSYPGRGQTRSI